MLNRHLALNKIIDIINEILIINTNLMSIEDIRNVY